jgi:hypothetical protein
MSVCGLVLWKSNQACVQVRYMILPWYSWNMAHLHSIWVHLRLLWGSCLTIFNLLCSVLYINPCSFIHFILAIVLWKKCLNSDGRQFYQYQQNEQPPLIYWLLLFDLRPLGIFKLCLAKRLHLPFQKWGICLICLHCATAMVTCLSYW